MKQIPKFPTLNGIFDLTLKKPEELIQILSDHGFKIPKDHYHIKSTIDEKKSTNSPILFLIGKKYMVRYRDGIKFSVFLIAKMNNKIINEIINGSRYYNEFTTYSNPVGFASWYFKGDKSYFINGEEITKNQFITQLAKKRIQAVK